jgi:hypothetical protein
MKIALLLIWLCIGSIPAFAQNQNGQGQNNQNNQGQDHRGAPAPVIGLGVPAALAIGGVLLGAKLLNRKR